MTEDRNRPSVLALGAVQNQDVRRVDRTQLERDFEDRFSGHPSVFSAPGRANLIGEHTDYNGGWVFPLGIDLRTYAAFRPASGGRVRLFSQNLDSGLETGLKNLERRGDWTDYVVGVVRVMQDEGLPVDGFDLLFDSEIPVGSGLSSSAALQVAAAFAITREFGHATDRLRIAALCQRAESDFVRVRCGIMDQLTSCCGRDGHALLLDCQSLAYERIPLPDGAKVVVCNTLVRHSHAEGSYNDRRRDCDEAVQKLQESGLRLRSLRDLTLKNLKKNAAHLTERQQKRCRHVITENQRVLEFRDALGRADLDLAGRLMKSSHASLRDDYEVSCEELDWIVSLADQMSGVFGSRLMGGGFGGCTVSLVEPGQVRDFRQKIGSGYEDRFGYRPWTHVCRAVEGARAEQG